MLWITVKADVPEGMAQGVKEALAMYLERFGDAEVVEVRETSPRQESLFPQRERMEWR